MNEGKKFEQDFRKSIPNDWIQVRLKDHAGWSHGDDKRFTPTNPCDLILFDGVKFYLLELKSCAKDRIPITDRLIKQAKELDKMPDMVNVYKFFILNYRSAAITYAVSVQTIMVFIHNNYKSIKLKDIERHARIIPQELIRTRYRYDFIL